MDQLTKKQQQNLSKIYEKNPCGYYQLYKIYTEQFGDLTKRQVYEWQKENKTKLTETQRKLLETVYYNEHYYFGIRKLEHFFKENYPEYNLTRSKITEWLKEQKVYQLNKPINFKRRATKAFTAYKSATLAIDLIDLSTKSYKDYKYVLTCIDIFSRYVWLFPLKTKTPQNVEKHLFKLLKDNKNFKVIITDNGKEFRIDLENAKIIKTQTYNPTNNALVERMNRNVRDLLRKYWDSNHKDWVAILPKFANNLNNTYQSTIKDTPNNVYYNYDEDKHKKLIEILKRKDKPIENEKLLPLGANVRILNKVKLKTGNKHLKNWSDDTFIVYKIIEAKNNVYTRYKLINTRTGLIERGTFNLTELQHIKGIIEPPKVKSDKVVFKNREVRELERIKKPYKSKRN